MTYAYACETVTIESEYTCHPQSPQHYLGNTHIPSPHLYPEITSDGFLSLRLVYQEFSVHVGFNMH